MSASESSNRKRRAAGLSVISNTLLTGGKLAIGLLTGSVAVVSEAVHSAMDLLAALIAFVAVSLADRPPDADHPHGHGKIENLSAAIEAILIFVAVMIIGYGAIAKLIAGGAVERVYLGAAVMGVSAVVNTLVSWHLQKVGEATDSQALLADAAHLRTDVYTSLGVFAGLLLVHFTGIDLLDPVVALAVALLIVREAWSITRRSVGDLLDESLPAGEERQIETIISAEGLSFHALRSRKAGSTRHIDLHLDVNPKATTQQIHDLCDRLEDAIEEALPGAEVLIHPEPRSAFDATAAVVASLKELLEQRRGGLRDYSDLRVHDGEGGLSASVRLELDPALSFAQVAQLQRDLQAQLSQRIPDAQAYFHCVPQRSKANDDAAG